MRFDFDRYAGTDQGRYLSPRAMRARRGELEGIIQPPQRLECLHCGVIGVDLSQDERLALAARHFKSAAHRRARRTA